MKHSVGCIPHAFEGLSLEDKRISLCLKHLQTCFSTVPMVNMLSQNYNTKKRSVILSKFSFPQGEKRIQKTTAAEDLTSFIPCFKIHTLKALFQSFINSTVNYTCLCCFLWHQTLVLFGQINFINIVSVDLMTLNAGWATEVWCLQMGAEKRMSDKNCSMLQHCSARICLHAIRALDFAWHRTPRLGELSHLDNQAWAFIKLVE